MTERQIFLRHLAQTSDFPLALEIERAEGVYLYSPSGKAYIDLIAGIGVSNVGHRHPKVVEAIKDQVDKYLHLMVYGEYIQSPQVNLAQALAASWTHSTNEPIQVYLTNSGTEAIEGAMKLAKRYTGRMEIVSCYNAYHGATQGALSLAGADFFKQNYRPLLPGIRQIEHGNYQDLQKISCRTAALVIEVVQGEAGVRVPEEAYLRAVRERCNQTGTLLIFDEIQSGFGRTGKFWAHEHFGVSPDVLVCAKGMGGGMPIGAFMAKENVMKVFRNNPILGHITTFGGHPVSAAASLATLEIIRDEQLLSQVPQKEELFRELLVHPDIRQIRSKGLMMAVEFDDFERVKPIIDTAIEDGVITDWFLFCDNSMRIAPPLSIQESEIRLACERIVAAIEKTKKG